MSVVRWIPFVFIVLGLTMLAEVGHVSDLFVAHFGLRSWDRLHFYGSTVLILTAYLALPRRYPWWRRLIISLVLVLSAGLLREIRQAYSHGPRAFSQHDMRSNLQGATVGSILSLMWHWRSHRKGQQR